MNAEQRQRQVRPHISLPRPVKRRRRLQCHWHWIRSNGFGSCFCLRRASLELPVDEMMRIRILLSTPVDTVRHMGLGTALSVVALPWVLAVSHGRCCSRASSGRLPAAAHGCRGENSTNKVQRDWNCTSTCITRYTVGRRKRHGRRRRRLELHCITCFAAWFHQPSVVFHRHDVTGAALQRSGPWCLRTQSCGRRACELHRPTRSQCVQHASFD